MSYSQYKQDIRLKFADYTPKDDIKRMQGLLEKYHNEMQDPDESFIYPLARNAYGLRVHVKEEKAEAKKKEEGGTGPGTDKN